MDHKIHRVESFEKVSLFTLKVVFDDTTVQVIDFRSVLRGDLYGPLNDPVLFDQVRVDSEVHTLVWPNGADFDPAILHDWTQAGSALRELADRWRVEKLSHPQ